ncbi:hypothetical protein GH733_007277 [Mirounga leonina]|nr:hypothetical protein GH733_007277 [Mirounga leonina]
MCCPECRGVSEKSDFKTNIALKKLASLARQAQTYRVSSSEEQICVLHKEAKGLFCEVNKNLLCTPCSESAEHMAHSHSLVQWAAEEYRDYVALRKMMIKAQYQKMHLFLHEEEQLHLETLEKEEKEIVQQLKESELRMTQQKESLKEMYRELTEVCHKPDVELLQDLGNVLQRTELAQMHKPQLVNPEFTEHHGNPRYILNNFRVDNVLSQETTGSYRCLSKDAGSVTLGVTHEAISRESQGAKSFAALRPQVFTSGQRYWEVDVTCSPNWILGVCKDSLTSDNDGIIHPVEAFLLFSLKINNRYGLSTNCPPLIQYVKRPLGQIGVFLDYNNGTVSFYDVYKGSLIYSFPPLSSFPLKPFLCLGAP